MHLALTYRLLAVVAAGLAGCESRQPPPRYVSGPGPGPGPTGQPMPQPFEQGGDPVEASGGQAATADTAELPLHAQPRPVVSTCEHGAVKRHCATPYEPPTGLQIIAPPGTYRFDANGCLAPEDVGHVCNGIEAMKGPSFEAGKCCYTICQGMIPPCGRPLMVDGRAHRAPLVGRADWLEPRGVRAPVDSASTDLDDRLRAAWLDDAAMEHASVASFARFSLELLAVGAPAEMVRQAHLAALDEIEHAKMLFAHASRLGAGDAQLGWGPGPLPEATGALRTGLDSIAVAAVREGCIGESLASLALGRAAELATSEDVRLMLATLAADEARHAELAFRFVAWAFRTGSGSTRAAIAAALAEPAPTPEAPAFDRPTDRACWLAAGRLDRAELEAIARGPHAALLATCSAAFVA